MTNRPRASVDQFLCIGSGNCVHLAPGAFELDENGVAVAIESSSAPLESLELAARSCPTAAIVVEYPAEGGS